MLTSNDLISDSILASILKTWAPSQDLLKNKQITSEVMIQTKRKMGWGINLLFFLCQSRVLNSF